MSGRRRGQPGELAPMTVMFALVRMVLMVHFYRRGYISKFRIPEQKSAASIPGSVEAEGGPRSSEKPLRIIRGDEKGGVHVPT